MKMVVKLELEVDAEAWARDWGIEKGAVREDVKEYLKFNALAPFLDGAGMIKLVEVK